MNPYLNFQLFTSFLILTLGAWASPQTPEQKALNFLKNEKPINDSTWKTIASTHYTEIYPILKGDTLSGVSKRLFGDEHYWPKLWAINNNKIYNPHMLKPGQVLIFDTGNGFSPPSLTLGTQESIKSALRYSAKGWEGPISATDEHSPKRSNEWKKIPADKWGKAKTQMSEGYDKDGFDKRNFKSIKKSLGYELPVSVSATPVQSLGHIQSSESGFEMLSLGDVVIVQSHETLKTDESYEIISPSETIHAHSQPAYLYWNVGQLKIKGRISEGYTAEITKARNPIYRGDQLLVAKTRTQEPPLTAAPEGLTARLYHSKQDRIDASTQHHWVILDEGSSRGIAPGMVFNTFLSIDQFTKHHLTSDSTFIQSQIKVFECNELFCLAKVEWSKDRLDAGTFASAITDLKELKFKYHWNGKGTTHSVSSPEPSPLEPNPSSTSQEPTPQTSPVEATQKDDHDWLDDLDDQKELNPSEEDELRKLEEYKEQNPIPTAPPTLDDAQKASEELLNEPAPQALPLETAPATPEPTPTLSPTEAPSSLEPGTPQLDNLEPEKLPEMQQQTPPAPAPSDELPLD